MKMIIRPLLCSLLIATPALAQDAWLDGLSGSQVEPSSSDQVGADGAPVRTKEEPPAAVSATTSGENCPSSGQKTIPLNFVSAMLRTRGDSLRVEHNAASGRLKIVGGSFLSNCNSMLDWNLRSPTSSFPQYVVELKVKSCGGSATCKFKAMEIVNGEQVEKEVEVTPDFNGFKQC
jgi:hypothetical protein